MEKGTERRWLVRAGFRLRNVSFRLRNVSLRLRNVSLRLRNVSFRLRNVSFRLRNVSFRLRNVSFVQRWCRGVQRAAWRAPLEARVSERAYPARHAFNAPHLFPSSNVQYIYCVCMAILYICV
jgi:division protein CdvB (Snf7/Vps24/ESCRT-III family)